MRSALLLAAVSVCVLTGLPVSAEPGVGTQPSAGVASPEDLLAAESLRHSAMCLIHGLPETPARAGRLVALGQFAQRLEPDHPKTAWLLASICEIQGRLTEAAEAARVQLVPEPADHALGLKYLRLSMAAFNQADERAEFLRSIKDGSWPDPLRAQAAARLSRILTGQGRQGEAKAALKQAAQLDPDDVTISAAAASAQGTTKPPDQARTATGVLRADPRNALVAKSLGVATGVRGLHEEALALAEHAWALADAPDVPLKITHALVLQYLNAMLDAGRFEQAIQSFEPILVQYPRSSDLRLLLIEAYQALGRQAEGGELIKAMEAEYATAQGGLTGSPVIARESAWFYTLVEPKPERALAIAQRAVEEGLDDAVSQRILAVAQLRSGQDELVPAAVRELQALAGNDIYAAAVLADYFSSRDATTKAKDLIAAGVKLGRSGPGWRYLRQIAEKHSIDVPGPTDEEALKQELATLIESYLPIGRRPEDFLRVELRPVRPTITAGEPLEIEASLTNRADVMIQLGQNGLINATMSPRVIVSDGAERSFENLPLVVWPAPKYLQSGQTVTTRVRLDVGELAGFLTKHPLDEFSLLVSGLLDPFQQDGRLVSCFPAEAVKSASIRHADPLGSFGRDDPANFKTAYQRMLSLTVTEINRGTVEQRMSAVRRLGALLAFAGEVRAGRARPPQPLVGPFSRPVLLSMLRKAIADPSPVVRAEMLAALGRVSLDEQVVSLLGAVVEDPSPLVRFRLVELLGASPLPGQDVMIERFAEDGDEMVRAMAMAFRDKQP